MKITLLGTGTSVGIPSLGQLGWGKCNQKNPKNKRQRCAVLIQSNNTNILIDAGPDIKNQLIGHNLSSLDGIIITHEHADHISGLDELRPLNTTNLWDGIHTSLEIIKKHTPPDRVRGIFVLTDGVPNVEPPRGHEYMLEKYYRQNEMKCMINCYRDSSLMQNIAVSMQDAYQSIKKGNSPFQIRSFLSRLRWNSHFIQRFEKYVTLSPRFENLGSQIIYFLRK